MSARFISARFISTAPIVSSDQDMISMEIGNRRYVMSRNTAMRTLEHLRRAFAAPRESADVLALPSRGKRTGKGKRA